MRDVVVGAELGVLCLRDGLQLLFGYGRYSASRLLSQHAFEGKLVRPGELVDFSCDVLLAFVRVIPNPKVKLAGLLIT